MQRMRHFAVTGPRGWWVEFCQTPLDPEIAKYPKNRGNSISFHKVELMAQCSECLLEGWNKTYACCQWSLLIARPDRLMLLLCCPSLMSRRQISCWVTPFLPCVRPITAILGKDPMLRVGDTGTIPFSMCWYKRVYYPGGECDSAADKGDCSRLWYVNTGAMKWSQTEWKWVVVPALNSWWIYVNSHSCMQ
jgi:hypothetical protein